MNSLKESGWEIFRLNGSFHFVLVPEGEYVLSVQGAGDGDYGGRGQWKKAQTYKDSTQPVSVHKDLTDLVAEEKLESTGTTASQ